MTKKPNTAVGHPGECHNKLLEQPGGPGGLNPPEHNFNVPLEEWEEAVFRNASYFAVCMYRALGQSGVNTFETFPEAMEAAKDNHKMLVYCIAKTERQFMIPRPQWARYMSIWSEMQYGEQIWPAVAKDRTLQITNSESGMIDITGADEVEVQINATGTILWVNTHVCRLRICSIRGRIKIDDRRAKSVPGRRR